MAIVTETLLRWRPVRTGPVSEVLLQTNDADFDIGTDTETGLPTQYNAITRVIVSGPRGLRFAWGAVARLKSEQQLIGPQSNHVLVPIGRVTTEGFSWDFTPDHVPVIPGSVSNPSLLTSGGNATIQASDTTAAFTPTANSLLVVASGQHRGNDTALAVTFSNTHAGSGAWSSVQVEVDSGTTRARHAQGRSQTGSAPGSGTVTFTYAANQPSRKSWVVAEITGHDTVTPLSESNTGGAGSGTTLSISIAGVAAGNLAISTMCLSTDTDTITSGTGETELAEATSGGSGVNLSQMQYSTDATHDWAWTTTERNAGVVVEYAEASEILALAASYQHPVRMRPLIPRMVGY